MTDGSRTFLSICVELGIIALLGLLCVTLIR
jgi:hypothetical protein